MRYAYVTTNILDLWMEPKFNSERASQVLFGELLAITEEQDNYVRVNQIDGYSGWVDKRHVREVDLGSFETYQKAPKVVVTHPQARITDGKGAALSPHILYYGTLLRIKRSASGRVRAVLPDGATLLIANSAVKPIVETARQKVTGAMLAKEAVRFLGVPYLWGGVSPAGFDCSGLVQSVCRRFGIYVPRDTKDQIAVGVEVSRDGVRAGDLLFFKRHVGFALDDNRIVHSSVGGSGVRINSLQSGMPDYREDLDRDFNQARRIL